MSDNPKPVNSWDGDRDLLGRPVWGRQWPDWEKPSDILTDPELNNPLSPWERKRRALIEDETAEIS
jgi:hypothetical protein